MIDRYTRPKMAAIWSLENKFKKWLEIEILACQAQAELGVIPKEAVGEIKNKAAFEVARIEEIEAEVHHDVIAFLTSVKEFVGESAKYIHFGMTSSDVVDTGLSLLMKEAIEILIEDAKELKAVLKKRAVEHKETIMIGRSHGIHAEPTTFGLKLALFAFEMERNIKRLEAAKETISYGKISGAVGTYANIDPFVEEYVCKKLGLKPAEVSTQVLQRDRHGEYMCALAILASTLDKMATEIRHLQRTEVLEAEEPFAKGQKGSSAMPHKKNPIISERISGLARVIRGNAQAALEDVALWHERDISHSSVERVIVPDSTSLLDYMMTKMIWLISNLTVYPKNMEANLNKTGGLFFSQKVLLALIEKGMSREDAYAIVQRSAMKTWQDRGDFKEELLADGEVAAKLSPAELDAIFDPKAFLVNVDKIFALLEQLN
ncbi:MAG: adenylosuccinate lyase [Actinomycetota bacterium]|nr:adenylosuccinate lyase [Actinomycetota bacterium]